VIEQYQNERQVEYVFDEVTYQLWLDNAEEPLRSRRFWRATLASRASRC